MKKSSWKPYSFFICMIFISNAALSQNSKGGKTYAKEFNLEKNSSIKINNSNRNLEIKFWEKAVLRIETNLPDSLKNKISEDDWTDILGIRVNQFLSRADVTISGSAYHVTQTNQTSGGSLNNLNGLMTQSADIIPPVVINEAAIASQTERTINFKRGIPVSGIITTTILYLPTGAAVDIINKNSTLKIAGAVTKAHLNITNTILDAANIGNLRLVAKYSTLNFESIVECEAEISNSFFIAKKIEKFDIESTRSTVEYEGGKSILIRSTLDNGYNIENIDVVEGRVGNGNIRIEKLNKMLLIEGNNCDVRVREINTEAELIKINNVWADLRLPVRGLKDYTVKFDGKDCSVFAPFEITEEKKEEPKQDKNVVPGFQTNTSNMWGKPNAPRYFTASVGNVSGKVTKFEITCQQCTLDFK